MIDRALLDAVVAAAQDDGELRLNASGWTGTVEVVDEGVAATFQFVNGRLVAGEAGSSETEPGPDDVRISGSESDWGKLLQRVPPAPFTDPFGARFAGMEVEGGPLGATRHLAVRRLVELMRGAASGTDSAPVVRPRRRRHGQIDAAVGRYVHLDLDGLDHRVYFEEAGAGIPLLCQHTAGADARQWRHLLEDERVTDRFRVVAYDLPYHGRSLPPEAKAWWAEPYVLTTRFAMAVPLALGDVLGLDRPVFIGSSVGGMLALDLARHHPTRFRAVIACEAALKLGPDEQQVPGDAGLEMDVSTDPAVHAASMMSWMGATAPDAYRHETRLHYAQGAPGVFAGDIHYFAMDHDLQGQGHLIDTARCAVHLLTGEYDFVTLAASREAAAAIPGATFEVMPGMGHFPMSEDPERFATHLLPLLDGIAAKNA
jgi:pimeloyl-ACP methyl ester carboxylesterase